MWCNSNEGFARYGVLVVEKHERIQIKILYMLKFEFSAINDHVRESMTSLASFLVKNPASGLRLIQVKIVSRKTIQPRNMR